MTSPGVQIDPQLAPLIAGYDIERIEQDDSIIMGVDQNFEIQLLNPAWRRQAERFGASWLADEWTLGRSLADALLGDEGRVYLEALSATATAKKPWQCEYDCDDPATRRRFVLVAYPLGLNSLLLVHSNLYEIAPGTSASQAIEARYSQGNRLVVRCAYCQRYRNPTQSDLWESTNSRGIPVEKTSHGVCHLCAAFHFG